MRLRHLLDEALDRPEKREELLEQLRAEGGGMEPDLLALLAESEEGEAEPAVAADSLAGRKLGPYRIERELGRGGMGTVFLAHREEQDVQRPVALKLLRHAYLEESAGRTFRRERSALARLDHPGITHLLDWGTALGGLPYLVLEYVEGEPITHYCAARGLPTRHRLELFLKVCEALQYAHSRLVVHRDLKPNNILVSTEGRVVVLDFGIAAMLDASAESGTTLQARLTPGYASPEQLRGESPTAADDVYSLGVVLRELAAEDLSRDLGNIIAKAERPEIARRYQTVEQVAADLRAYLEHRPVEASRGNWLYRVERFVRRNRTLLGVGGLAGLAVACGLAVAAMEWRAERRRTAELREFAHATLSAMGETIGATGMELRITQAAIRQLDGLSRGGGLDQQLQSDIASAYEHLGDTQGLPMAPNLGDMGSAEKNFQKAAAIRLLLWKAQPDAEHGMMLMGNYGRLGKVAPDAGTAVAILRQGIAVAEKVMPMRPNDPGLLARTASLHHNLGNRLRTMGKFSEALTACGKSVEFGRRAIAIDPAHAGGYSAIQVTEGEMSNTFRIEGKYEEALAAAKQAFELATKALALETTPLRVREVAYKHIDLGAAYLRLKRFGDARTEEEEALRRMRAIEAADGSNRQAKADVVTCLEWLAEIDAGEGRLADALTVQEQAVRFRKEQTELDGRNYFALRSYADGARKSGRWLVKTGKLEEAANRLAAAETAANAFLRMAPSELYGPLILARCFQAQAELELRERRAGYRERARAFLEKCLESFGEARRRSPEYVDIGIGMDEAQALLARLK